jgi:hypothetical protein
VVFISLPRQPTTNQTIQHHQHQPNQGKGKSKHPNRKTENKMKITPLGKFSNFFHPIGISGKHPEVNLTLGKLIVLAEMPQILLGFCLLGDIKDSV